MYNPKPEKIFEMFERMCKTHRDELLTATLDWEVLSLTYPGYSKKIDQHVPLLLMEFK